jgi:hypothetical protein
LATDEGWPRPLQAWKGEGKKMLLDKDKKRHSKVKEGRSVVFWDYICCKSYKIKSLLK